MAKSPTGKGRGMEGRGWSKKKMWRREEGRMGGKREREGRGGEGGIMYRRK
jgi:hypothetical protein